MHIVLFNTESRVWNILRCPFQRILMGLLITVGLSFAYESCKKNESCFGMRVCIDNRSDALENQRRSSLTMRVMTKLMLLIEIFCIFDDMYFDRAFKCGVVLLTCSNTMYIFQLGYRL